jgi:hypothetical protein
VSIFPSRSTLRAYTYMPVLSLMQPFVLRMCTFMCADLARRSAWTGHALSEKWASRDRSARVCVTGVRESWEGQAGRTAAFMVAKQGRQ